MNNGKQNLAAAVREARTELGLSQERLPRHGWSGVSVHRIP